MLYNYSILEIKWFKQNIKSPNVCMYSMYILTTKSTKAITQDNFLGKKKTQQQILQAFLA